jgi:hypothetical protein
MSRNIIFVLMYSHHKLLDLILSLICLIIFGEDYKLRSTLLSSITQPFVISFLLGPNTHLSIMFPETSVSSHHGKLLSVMPSASCVVVRRFHSPSVVWYKHIVVVFQT